MLWGFLFLGLGLLTAHLTYGPEFFLGDNLVAVVLMFGLALLSACSLLAGLYLLLRVLI